MRLHLGVLDVPYKQGSNSSPETTGDVAEILENRYHPIEIFYEEHANIETRFRHFLSQKEMDSLGVPGVPTKAALAGVSHRFKHPYAKRAPRPSFIDTGLYEASFRAWVEK